MWEFVVIGIMGWGRMGYWHFGGVGGSHSGSW